MIYIGAKCKLFMNYSRKSRKSLFVLQSPVWPRTSGTISAERCYALEWGSGMLLNDGDLVQDGNLSPDSVCPKK